LQAPAPRLRMFSARLANLLVGFSHIEIGRTIKVVGSIEANNRQIRLIGDLKAGDCIASEPGF
jgi:hypothetical protein